MNRETYDQLEEGYEAALDLIPELSGAVSDAEEGIVDAISDLRGDLQSLICTLRICLRAIRQTTPPE